MLGISGTIDWNRPREVIIPRAIGGPCRWSAGFRHRQCASRSRRRLSHCILSRSRPRADRLGCRLHLRLRRLVMGAPVVGTRTLGSAHAVKIAQTQ
jgi:hypothetical protein